MAPSRRSQGHRSHRAFGAKPAHDSALVATGFRDVLPGLPSTMSLSTTDVWCLKPLHAFGIEGQRHSGSSRGGLFLRNNTHTTRVASALSLNNCCSLHQTNRSRTWTEANHLAGCGMMLLKTIFPNNSPSSVWAVLPFRWAELTTNPSSGEKRALELPRTAHADARQVKDVFCPLEILPL
jgi:hypothetical protein